MSTGNVHVCSLPRYGGACLANFPYPLAQYAGKLLKGDYCLSVLVTAQVRALCTSPDSAVATEETVRPTVGRLYTREL